MSYFNLSETEQRLKNVKEILINKGLDMALIYYDELNIANGWYLTGWCPQFEKGAIVVPVNGNSMILGGPESEPFAKASSAITETRNFTAFMVPDEEYPNAKIIDFNDLFEELRKNISIKKIGIVGTDSIPHSIYMLLQNGFKDVELVDMTKEYVTMRFHKSEWELENIRKGFELSYQAYKAMKSKVIPGNYEYEVAAAGEEICRRNGANGFGFSTIVGSGERANAVVPTALNKEMIENELVMIGIAPKINGYCGVVGDTLSVSGNYSKSQKECVNHLREAFRITKNALKPGISGREIDKPARKYYEENGLLEYLVCPFVHTIGLNEAESPFFGPNSDDILVPGMAICIDVSFFGHPEFNGARIETGYRVTETGIEAFCPEMDRILCEDI